MAFKLGDLIIDRIVDGVGEVASGADAGKLLYHLTNLQEASINVTADSVDAVDGTGAVIKTFYRGKQGEFTATNSTLSLPIIEQMSGTSAQEASTSNPIDMPMIITTSAKTGIALPGITDNGANAGLVVNVVSQNGTLGRQIQTANLTVTTGTPSTLEISGTTSDETMFIIKYNRTVTENGILVQNESNKFPKTHKLTLKVLIVDPCEPDIIRAAYIVCPSFQPSAEIDFSISTDATLDFSGVLQTSYCGTEKVLYQIYVCADDEEDAA